MMTPRIIFLNGSCQGDRGKTAQLLQRAAKTLAPVASISQITLAVPPSKESLHHSLAQADGFIFGTGTYWDSWGSPLQRFLEEMTTTEGSTIWLGKPAAVVITMHSVGGKGVLSRLQGVLNTLGVLLPPMSGMVYSAVNQLAIEHQSSPLTDDLWCLSDIDIICHNLVEACSGSRQWKTWPVDGENFDAVWAKRPA